MVITAVVVVGCADLVGIDEPASEPLDASTDGEPGGSVDVRPLDAQLVDGPPPDAPASACDGGCAEVDAAPNGCPAGRGSPMLRVSSGAGVPFCIDAFEATQADYGNFRAGFALSAQEPACSWNTTYDPEPGMPSLPGLPITDIDFCDAVAFCTWAGKHLCGRVSTDGGAAGGFRTSSDDTLADEHDPSTDQWFAACAGPSGLPYPYGASAEDGVCNVAPDDGGASVIAAPGSFPACDSLVFGGGLYDMSGNAEEWVDRCYTDADGGLLNCIGRGGSFQQDASTSTCSILPLDDHPAPSSEYPYLGVRCCADLPPTP